MFELLITLVERVGIIVTIAFVLTRLRFFRKMFYQDQLNRQQTLTAVMFFAFFGIIGTYTGLNVNTESLQFNRWASDLMTEEAIANSRVIGIVIAGLLGGQGRYWGWSDCWCSSFYSGRIYRNCMWRGNHDCRSYLKFVLQEK